MSPRGRPENRPLGRTDVAYGLLVAWKSPGGVCEGKKGSKSGRGEGVRVGGQLFLVPLLCASCCICSLHARCRLPTEVEEDGEFGQPPC